MRVREILIKDFRSFRGERRISFVDPVTDIVRPVSVLAGSNGAGKTTVLDIIDGLLTFLQDRNNPGDLVSEAKKAGLIAMGLEISPCDLLEVGADKESLQKIAYIVVGQHNLAPQFLKDEWPSLMCHLVGPGKPYTQTDKVLSDLRSNLTKMRKGEADLYGGLIYFPHYRQLMSMKGGPIEPPPDKRQVIYRFSNDDRWQGSLEQLWV